MHFLILILATLVTRSGLSGTYGMADYLQTLEQQSSIQSIDQALSLLPAPLRRNFTLIYESRGVNAASPELPRAILFTEDAKFIVSFNAKSPLGLKMLEFRQYNDQTESFELLDLPFPLKRAADGKLLPPVKNSPLCLSCHGNMAAPTWQTNNHWRGVYGSADDRITPDYMEEFTNFQHFKASAPSLPRYRHLLGLDDSLAFPYRAAESDLKARPNLRLTILLTRLFARQLAQTVLQAPHFQKHRELVRYNLCVNQHPDTPPLEQSLQNRILSELRQDLRYSYSDLTNTNRIFSALTGRWLNEFCWREDANPTAMRDCLDRSNDHGIKIRDLVGQFIEAGSMQPRNTGPSLGRIYLGSEYDRNFARMADHMAAPVRYQSCSEIEQRLRLRYK
jgi:hypothetical protein